MNIKNTCRACNEFAIRNIFPLGWLILLTGMFWLDRSGTYHRLFYWLLVLPCAFVLLSDFKTYRHLLRQPIFLVILIFLAYMLATLFWSSIDRNLIRGVKIPFLTLIFILSAAIFYLKARQRFEAVLHISALIATVAAACSLVYYNYNIYTSGYSERLSGYFLLDNALISTHVYGAFATYWLTQIFLSGRAKTISIISMLIIVILLIQTGSKTPFVAIGLALAWLLFIQGKQKECIAGMFFVMACALIQYKISISFNTWTGYSFRPEIWAEIIRQISESPWFGLGYKSPIVVQVSGHEFYDNPHNIPLAVLHAGGIVGFVLWMLIYVYALRFSWQFRKDNLVIMASTWLIYGIGGGLTEGRAFMSLPKEHWFLIWIPLAILFAASASQSKKDGKDSSKEDCEKICNKSD